MNSMSITKSHPGCLPYIRIYCIIGIGISHDPYQTHQHVFSTDNVKHHRPRTKERFTTFPPALVRSTPLSVRPTPNLPTSTETLTLHSHIVMHFHRAITPASAVSDLLDAAIAFVHHRAATGFADIVIGPVGYHRIGARALTLTAEGQRLTWGVLAVALVEVRAWMDEPGRAYGIGSFEIWVGNVRVGDGGISVDA